MTCSDIPSTSSASELSPQDLAARGHEITGLSIYKDTNDDITMERVHELLSEMNSDVPQGGTDIVYGGREAQRLRLWKPISDATKAPVAVYVHGGSWTIGTYLDSTGSKKVSYLNDIGYAFASINYTLIPTVTVEEQVQEVADSVAYLIKNSEELGIDPERVVLMGHSSGAHVVTLLGTDPSYAEKAGFGIDVLKGVIALDGSNYNALAEFADNTGPIITNMVKGLSDDPVRLQAMSPTHHAAAPNAGAFLLLHVQRKGDIRQAVELSVALKAAGTDVDLHVFEGEGFEGHVAMLLRLGDAAYPATLVMEEWLKKHVPV
jgi:acetyl esterase/lipase